MKYKFATIPLDGVNYHFVIVATKEEFTTFNEPVYRNTLKMKHHDGTIIIGYKSENGLYTLSSSQIPFPPNVDHMIDNAVKESEIL
jgi:hypothetical protein